MGSLHICNNDETPVQSVYSCRLCCSKFPSICILHDHILQCSGEGTYIYDNRFRTVYSLSFDQVHDKYHPDQSVQAKDGLSNIEADKIIKEIHELLKAYANVYKRLCSHILLNNSKSESNETKDEHSSTEREAMESVLNDEPTKRKRGRPRKGTIQRNKCIKELSRKKVEKPSQQYATHNRCRKRVMTNKNQLKDNDTRKNLCKKGKVEPDDEGMFNGSVKEETVDKAADTDDIASSLLTIDEQHIDEDASQVKNREDVPGIDKESSQIRDIKTEVTGSECSKLKSKPVGGVNKSNIATAVRNNKVKDDNPRSRCGRKKLDLETCEVCGKRVKRSKLKIHAISHSDNRPYQCKKCPKTYKYPEHLAMHMKSHDDVLPYYCEVCGQGFVDANRLKRHAVMHTSNRPFQCPTCSAGFVTRYKLERHMFVHTGVKMMQCDLCGMRFAHKENLSQHIACIHKKEHRFSCPDCHKTFFTNYQLKCHSMKHAGVRPYKCSHCSSDFIERKELRRHMRKQHHLNLDGQSLTSDSCKAQDTEVSSHVQGQITPGTEINSGNSQGKQLMETECVIRPGHSSVTDLDPVLTSNLQGNIVSEGNQGMSFQNQPRLDMLTGSSLPTSQVHFDREGRGTSLVIRDGQVHCGSGVRKVGQMSGAQFRTPPPHTVGFREGKQFYVADGCPPVVESTAVVDRDKVIPYDNESVHPLVPDRYQYMVIPAAEHNSDDRFTIL